MRRAGALRRTAPALLVALLATVGLAPTAWAESEEMPRDLVDVGFEQRLGEAVPAELAFTDERGGAVRLGDLWGERPVLLVPVYYECPMLCSLVLNGLVTSLRAVDFAPGDEMEVVVVSFDPREGPEEAAATRELWLERYGRPETDDGWHFLTGGEEAILALTDAIGFRYSWDEEGEQWAHAAGFAVLTPEGRVARYLFGIEYAPRDLRLALVEAADGEIGNPIDQALLYCFRYDPESGTYSAVVMNIVRLSGAVTVAAIALFLSASLLRERRRRRQVPA